MRRGDGTVQRLHNHMDMSTSLTADATGAPDSTSKFGGDRRSTSRISGGGLGAGGLRALGPRSVSVNMSGPRTMDDFLDGMPISWHQIKLILILGIANRCVVHMRQGHGGGRGLRVTLFGASRLAVRRGAERAGGRRDGGGAPVATSQNPKTPFI